MAPNDSSVRAASNSTIVEKLNCEELIVDFRRRFLAGEIQSSTVVLGDASLAANKSVVLDLAYEEFCLRVERGESVDPVTFAGQFPRYQKSLARLLEVHGLVADNPHFIGRSEVTWPAIGSDFLGFTLCEELGRGSFARVFLATENSLANRLVVLKVAVGGEAEAETIAKLSHPHVVPINAFYVEQSTGLTAFCMPYLGRATFCDVLDEFSGRRTPKSVSPVLDRLARINTDDLYQGTKSGTTRQQRNVSFINWVLGQYIGICEALAYAHSEGICHGDLKPSNVLATAAGKPMLVDFNLSFHGTATRARGTLPYMAPEQLASAAAADENCDAAIDARSDIYSAGVMLYELLTGGLPFGVPPTGPLTADTCQSIRDRQRDGISATAKAAGLDRSVLRLLNKCLAFDPADRFQNAAELAAALKRSLSARARVQRYCLNHRVFVGFSLLIIAVVSLWAAYALASRPTYDMRQFNNAITCFEEHRFAEAIEFLNRSLASNPNSIDARFLRARAEQKLNQFELAYADLGKLSPFTDDPRITAEMGYCLSVTSFPKFAAIFYEKALKDGLQSPEVLNNLGVAHADMANLEEAIARFSQAIDLDPTLGLPYRNRATAKLNRSFQTGMPLEEDAVVDIRKALQRCPQTSLLFELAATICLTAGKTNIDYQQAAVDYLETAIRIGRDPERLRKNALLRSLLNDERIVAAIDQSTIVDSPPRDPLLIDPLPDSTVSLSVK